MKFSPLTFLFILFTNLSSFAQWQWQNPLPQGNTLHDIQFVNSTTGFAVGDGGTILKTTDAGASWTRIATEWLYDLENVCFPDPDHGYAVSPSYILLKTTDGGQTWSLLNNLPFVYDTHDVFFSDSLHGMVVGTNCLYLTFDGGMTWQWPTPFLFYSSAWFTDSLTGFVASDGEILKSYDGGLTWNTKSSSAYGWQGAFFFMNSDTGFHVGGGGRILRTIDLGETWTIVPAPTTQKLTSVFVLPSGIGYATGHGGVMLKTIDAGITWTMLPAITTLDLQGVSFADELRGIITGNSGTVLVTLDGGTTWTSQSSLVTAGNISTLCFPTTSTGYAAGSSGLFLKTTNGGTTWNMMTTGSNVSIAAACFTHPDTGFLAGDYGTILKTTDGGNNWFCPVTGVSCNLVSIEFPDAHTGYSLGVNPSAFPPENVILKTNDAGNTWAILPTPRILPKMISFVTAETGFIACDNPWCVILHTSNGGLTWVQVSVIDSVSADAMCFVNEHLGFISGYSGANSGVIYKTADGGSTWNLSFAGSMSSIHRIFFTDAMNGYANQYCHSWPYGNGLLKTTDGGETWTDASPLLTNYPIHAIWFTGADTGYLAGNNGVILKTTDGGVITSTERSKPVTGINLYPNPNTGNFIIDRGSADPSCSINIFDFTGSKIGCTQYHDAGAVRVRIPGAKTGIYIVRISSGTSCTTRKVVVVAP